MKTAFCIASGPSLTQEDIDYCRGKGPVYVVKECAFAAPWADVLYAADADWWDLYKGCPEFAGEKWTVNVQAAQKYGLNYAAAKTQLDWSDDLAVGLATGGNSGFQTMNLAVLREMQRGGLDRLVLLGYDMGFKPGTQKHWWDKQHPRASRESNYGKWIERMAQAAPKIPVPVLNASRATAITCFPHVFLRDVL